MTTRDPFLDALAVRPSVQKYWQESASESVAEDYRTGNVRHMRAPFPVKPPPAAPKPTPPIAPHGQRDPNIDAMIAAWVEAGELILDVELDAYRVPRRRRWRLATKES